MVTVTYHTLRARRDDGAQTGTEAPNAAHRSPALTAPTEPTLRKKLYAGLLRTLPFTLFVSFCICPSTATSIFSAWTCISFPTDGHGGSLSYLYEEFR